MMTLGVPTRVSLATPPGGRLLSRATPGGSAASRRPRHVCQGSAQCRLKCCHTDPGGPLGHCTTRLDRQWLCLCIMRLIDPPTPPHRRPRAMDDGAVAERPPRVAAARPRTRDGVITRRRRAGSTPPTAAGWHVPGSPCVRGSPERRPCRCVSVDMPTVVSVSCPPRWGGIATPCSSGLFVPVQEHIPCPIEPLHGGT
jgi:hypothetical protein